MSTATTSQESTEPQGAQKQATEQPSEQGSATFAKLAAAARDYATAKGSSVVKGLGNKVSGMSQALNKPAEAGDFTGAAAGTTAEKMAEGESAPKAALAGVASGVKEKVGKIFGGDKGGGKKKLPTSIIEDIYVGVPVDVAYNQWTQYQELPAYTKGPQSVSQEDEQTTRWLAKIGLSTREWTTTIREQVPDRRIAWTSEGDKGTVDGVITFHPLADDLTLLLLVLEYQPKGFVEWMGNRWRVVGRRARLDLKHYRRFVMMSGEATGAWRGEIREGEVVSSGGETGRGEPQQPTQQTEQRQPQQERQVPAQGERQTGEAKDRAGKEESKREGKEETAASPIM